MYYTGCLGPGGAERQLCYMAKEAVRNGYRVCIVIDYPIIHFREITTEEKIEIVCTHTTWKTPLKRVRMLRKVLRDFRPDIFHSFLSTKNIWGTLLSKRTKVPVRVASIRNTNRSAFTGLRAYGRWATHVVCNSVLASDIAKERFKKGTDKIRAIPNGIDLPLFSKTKSQKFLRKDLGLSDDTLLGVTVARFVAQKNHRSLLGALRALKRSGKWEGVHHVLIGNIDDRPLYESVKTYIDQAGLTGFVTFLEVTQRIEEILPQCDFFVQSSLFEGFPNAVMEAMASNVFVIATPVGDTPLLIENGITGILCASSKEGDIKKGMETYLTTTPTRRNEIKKNAIEKIQGFSIEKIFSQFDNLYRSQD